MKKTLVVSENDGGQRLDRFLIKAFRHVPKSAIFRWIRTKKVRVNGGRATPEQLISAGDVLVMHVPARDLDELEKDTLQIKPGSDASDLSILHEDYHVLIVDKPAGLPVHGGTDVGEDHLTTQVRSYLSDKIEPSVSYNPGPVHRLDRETSGIVVYSKTALAHRVLCEHIRNRVWTKVYYGLIRGQLDPTDGSITIPLKQKEENRNEKKLEAVTRYKTLAQGSDHSLLELQPVTGRFRQIRRHLALNNKTLVGETRYGEANVSGELNVKRLFLHAAKLECKHPITEKVLIISAPVPSELAMILTQLELEAPHS